ncbi:MAG: nucleotide-binding protein [Chloroflexi bacterium]|nr:nucleotide-binding protein [Chloroflexota bacterium]
MRAGGRALQADLRELQGLVDELKAHGHSWHPRDEAYQGFIGAVRNIIGRNYPPDEAQQRLEELDKAADYHLTAVVHRFGEPDRTTEVERRDYLRKLPTLRAHVGNLLSDIRIRADLTDMEGSAGMATQELRIFIAHGGRTKSREKLERFIRALGAEPVVFEEQAAMAATPSTKVDALIKGCDYGVVLVTKAGASVQAGKAHPRGNVTDEFARARAAVSDRWMIMVEKGVELPSNVTEFVREGFSRVSMDGALTALVRELRAHGMLEARGVGEGRVP